MLEEELTQSRTSWMWLECPTPRDRIMRGNISTWPDAHSVSYPKKVPPNAANAHLRYPLTVAGASL